MQPEKLRKLLKKCAIAGAFFAVSFVLFLLARGGSSFARGLLWVYLLLIGLATVLVILLQSGRGGGLASLGGIGGEGLLGARAATPIAKATYVLGALLLFTAALMARLPKAPSGPSAEVLGEEPASELNLPATPGGEEPAAEQPQEPAGGSSGGAAETPSESEETAE